MNTHAIRQRHGFVRFALLTLALFAPALASAQSLNAASDKIVARLQAAGFEIVGRLEPSRFQVRRGLQWADVSIGVGNNGDGQRPIPIIKSSYLMATPVDRKALEWWKIGRFESLSVNVLLTDVVHMSTVCWSEDYGAEIKAYFAACEDFQKRFRVQKQFSAHRKDIGRIPPDSTLVPSISTREMDFLIAHWQWTAKPQPPKRKPKSSTGIQGGEKGLPCGATIEGIGLGIMPAGPSVILMSKVEVDEGVEAAVVVKRLWPNGPGWSKLSGEELHRMMSSQDCFFEDELGYHVTRTIHLNDKTTVGKLREDLLSFARYVKTLPSR